MTCFIFARHLGKFLLSLLFAFPNAFLLYEFGVEHVDELNDSGVDFSANTFLAAFLFLSVFNIH